MGTFRIVNITVLASILLASFLPLFAKPAFALGPTNIVADPSFELTSSSAWFVRSALGNGTVNVHTSDNSHNATHSAKLSAINTTLQCPSSLCTDTARAEVGQSLTGNVPTLNTLQSSNDSFSAWWFVDPSSPLPPYSLHIGLQFSDGSLIEYWYGHSDLSNSSVTPTSAVFNLGPIPTAGTWFEMHRNLVVDVRGVVLNPSSTRVTTLWFGAFGGSFMECPTCPASPHGETAWVDDAAIEFNIPRSSPVAVFASSPAQGTAPLDVKFNASSSYVPSGFASIIVFMWDFGDGSPVENVSDPVTTHTFSKAGTFAVTLTVIDTNNVRSSASSTTVKVDPVDTIPLLVVAGGAAGLLVGVLLVRSRRRSSNQRRARQKMGRR